MTSLVLHGAELETLEALMVGLLGSSRRYVLPGEARSNEAPLPTLKLRDAREDQVSAGDEIELCDPENTPLARLTVDHMCELEPDGALAVAGEVRQLRAPEHGPARGFRLTPGEDLSGATVALFSADVRPADVLRASQAAGGAPLVLVADGVASADAARVVRLLHEVCEVLPDARVRFIPLLAFDRPGLDAARGILARLGASDVLDFREDAEVSGTGAVVLFTGLSGAGKSTVARALAESINAMSRQRAVLLDGDHLRGELAPELGFSFEDRQKNLVRQAWVAARVAEAGGIAICAPIAPFAVSRDAMRAKVEPEAPFIIVHVSTPLEVAEARDRKGLYARARAGEITDFTGVHSPYEIPVDADVTIDTSELSVEKCVAKIRTFLYSARLLKEG